MATAEAEGVAGPGGVCFHSSAGAFDVLPPAAKTILGDYVVSGVNHGRRTYRRRQPVGKKLPELVLFFWDTKNGKENSGWWVGSRVGGGQVFARNTSSSTTPPQHGWRSPVEGPPQKRIACYAKDIDEEVVDAEEEVLTAEPVIAASSKRAGGSAAPPKAKRPAKTQTLVLSTNIQNAEQRRQVECLLGEYVQMGMNHGKKTYFKKGVGEKDPHDPSVWLYYWDGRDGFEASGWWLGRSVGGAEVFAWAMQHSAVPAPRGWRIPHHGLVRHDVTLMPKGRDEDADAPVDERLAIATKMVAKFEADSESTLSIAKDVLGGETLLEEGVQAVGRVLQQRIHECNDATSSLNRHLRAARKHHPVNSKFEGDMQLLQERVDLAKTKLDEQLSSSSDIISRTQRQQAEEDDARIFGDLLTTAMDLVAQAELEAEENRDAASDAVEAAIANVEKCLESARGWAPEIRRVALSEFTSLRSRCKAVENRGSRTAFASLALKTVDNDPASAHDFDTDSTKLHDGDKVSNEMGVGEAGIEDDDSETRTENEVLVASKLMLQSAPGKRVASAPGSDEALSEIQNTLDSVDMAMSGHSAVSVSRLGQDAVKLRVDLFKRKSADVRAAQKKVAQAVRAVLSSPSEDETSATLEELSCRLSLAQERLSKAISVLSVLLAPTGEGGVEFAEEYSVAKALGAVDQVETTVEELLEEVNESAWWTSPVFLQNAQSTIKSVDAIQNAADLAEIEAEAARGRLETQVRLAEDESPESRKIAMEHLAPAQTRLIDLQLKLAPLRGAAKLYYTQLKALEELEDIGERIDAAEVSRSYTVHAELEEVLELLQKGDFSRIYPKDRKTMPGGGLKDALLTRKAELLEQAQTHAKTLEDKKLNIQRKAQKTKGEVLLDKAIDLVESLQIWLPRLVAAEEPWTDGREILEIGHESSLVLDEAETVSKRAEMIANKVKTSLLETLVEARRYSDAPGLIEGLQVLQHRVDSILMKATVLRTETIDRQAKAQMADVVHAVVAGEAAVRKVADVAKATDEDNIDGPNPPKGLAEVCKTIMELEPAAAKACSDARLALSIRRADPKYVEGSDFNAALSKLAGRFSTISGQLAGFKKIGQEAGKNWNRVKEHKAAFEKVEKLVEEAELANLPIGDERETSEQVEDSRVAATLTASKALENWRAECEPLAEHPHGGFRIAMQRLLERSNGAQKRLQEVEAMGRPWREKALCRAFVREAAEMITKAEASLSKAEEADAPFLKGIEVSSMGLPAATKTVQACEAAVNNSSSMLADAQSFVSAKRRDVARFIRIDAATRAKMSTEFEALVVRTSEVSKKLGYFRRQTQARRRALARSSAPRTVFN